MGLDSSFRHQIPRRFWIGIVAGILGSVAPGHGAAEQQVVPDAQLCPSCTLEIVGSMHVGDVDGPGALASRGSASIDAEGRLWVTTGRSSIQVFDPAGRFLREVGQLGEGPGEFRLFVRNSVPVGDSMAILDAGGRITIVGPGFEFIRASALPISGTTSFAVIRWPDAVVANVSNATTQSVPLHLFDVSSNPSRQVGSFGADVGLGAGVQYPSSLFVRVFSPSRDGTIWVGDRLRYRLSRWDTAGSAVDVIWRRPDWFPDWRGPILDGVPAITALSEDATGRLWVFLRVPKEDWRERWDKALAACPPLPAGPVDVPATQICRPPNGEIYDFMVEVIDSAAARVVARLSIDRDVIGVLSDGRVVAYAEPNMIPTLEIMSLDLVVP